jgi:hypothetical protein
MSDIYYNKKNYGKKRIEKMNTNFTILYMLNFRIEIIVLYHILRKI